MAAGQNYVYIVRCRDGTLYTGWTKDIGKRIKAHNAGRGAKYTKPRLPVELVYTEQLETERQARRREYRLKHISRREKLSLIENGGRPPCN
jgi:putative endonuclease